MTGFLQRLAERATGAVQPLRRVPSPLFAPSPIEAVPPPAAPAEAAMPAAVADRAPTPLRAGAAPGVPPARDGATGLGTPPDRRDGVPGMGGETPRDDAPTGHRPAAADGRPPVPASLSAGARPQALMPARRDPPQAHTSPFGIGSGSPPSSSRGPDGDHGDAPRPVPTAVPAVEPLLPPAPPPPAPARPKPAARPAANPAANPAATRPGQAGPAPGAVEETTEVHISIGRIEVTAVHEPAPAKPAAPRRTAPMSLDDYLAKRHGGRT